MEDRWNFSSRVSKDSIGGAPKYCKNRYGNSERVSPLGSGRLSFTVQSGAAMTVSIKSSYLNNFAK